MPRTVITPQAVGSAGVVPATEAANVLGNSVVPAAAGTALRVTNGSGGSINVTVQTPGVVDNDLALPDRVVAVAAGATKYIAGLANPVYRQSDGTVLVDYSAVTTVTVAVLQFA